MYVMGSCKRRPVFRFYRVSACYLSRLLLFQEERATKKRLLHRLDQRCPKKSPIWKYLFMNKGIKEKNSWVSTIIKRC